MSELVSITSNLASAEGYILSFSRKTDGPRYYADWFEHAWRRGWADARNSFGGPIHAELGPDAVTGFLGWTRDARPFARCIDLLERDGIPMVWQFTITPYARDLELRRPADAVGALSWLRERLPASSAIQWRYDPIILNDRYSETWHQESFGELAEQLRDAVAVCNVSIVEAFTRTVRRVDDASVRYRPEGRNFVRAIARKPTLRPYAPGDELLARLGQLGRACGIEVRACANPELPLPASQCCSLEMFDGYGPDVLRRLDGARTSPTRPGCRCLRSKDIGMDNTCVAGCLYCYAVTSDESAVRNRRSHEPQDPRMRPSRLRP
ncbi:MAG: DUF1848 family protein [Deltaproteobacteria bacterium]|nr:DUF1848 family protein [Deltaproteobacteria bacterium]